MMVHSDRSCDDKDGPSTSGMKNGDFNEPELPVSSTVDIKPFNSSNRVESSAMFNGKISPANEEDMQTEHNQNLANAMRNYLVSQRFNTLYILFFS